MQALLTALNHQQNQNPPEDQRETIANTLMEILIQKILTAQALQMPRIEEQIALLQEELQTGGMPVPPVAGHPSAMFHHQAPATAYQPPQAGAQPDSNAAELQKQNVFMRREPGQ